MNKSLRYVGSFLLIMCAIKSASATTYFDPVPDFVYRMSFRVSSDIVKGEIKAEEHPDINSYYGKNTFFYTIKNSSDKPFFTLYTLKNGFEWRQLAEKGYLPNIRITSTEQFSWHPYAGGWDDSLHKDDFIENEKIGRTLPLYEIISLHNNGKSVIDEKSGDKTVKYKIPFFSEGKIGFFKLQAIYGVTNDYKSWVKYKIIENPLSYLKVITTKRDSGEIKYSLKVTDKNKSIDFLELCPEGPVLFKGIPKEYFPRKRVKNNVAIDVRAYLNNGSKYRSRERVLEIQPYFFNDSMYNIINHNYRAKTMPFNLKIPKTQKIEIPVIYGEELHSMKFDINWEKNKKFVPFARKGPVLGSCTGSMCFEAMENSNQSDGTLNPFYFVILYLLSLLPFSIFFFLWIKLKGIMELSYLKISGYVFTFMLIDLFIHFFLNQYIFYEWQYVNYAGSVLMTSLCWSSLKTVFYFIFKNFLSGKWVKVFSYNFVACLITVIVLEKLRHYF